MECEEPRCNEPATKSWGGRKVCSDHYEEYQEKRDRDVASMKEY